MWSVLRRHRQCMHVLIVSLLHRRRKNINHASSIIITLECVTTNKPCHFQNSNSPRPLTAHPVPSVFQIHISLRKVTSSEMKIVIIQTHYLRKQHALDATFNIVEMIAVHEYPFLGCMTVHVEVHEQPGVQLGFCTFAAQIRVIFDTSTVQGNRWFFRVVRVQRSAAALTDSFPYVRK